MLLKKVISIALSIVLLTGVLPVNAQQNKSSSHQDEWNQRWNTQLSQLDHYQLTNKLNNQIYNYNRPSLGPNFSMTHLEMSKFGRMSKEEQKQYLKKRNKDIDIALADIIAKATMDEKYNPYKGFDFLDAYQVWLRLPDNRKTGDFNYDYYIDPSWKRYEAAKRDPYTSQYKMYRPYDMHKEMTRVNKSIAESLKKNPRYIAEVKNHKRKQAGAVIVTIVSIAIVVVGSIYTCGALGCSAGTAFFSTGTTAGAAAVATTSSGFLAASSMSLAKATTLIILLDIAGSIGIEAMGNLYEDLNARLVSYNYIEISEEVKGIINVAATKSLDDNLVVDTATLLNEQIVPETQWLDNIAREQAIIRMEALNVIDQELKHSKKSYKYDLALLDIINLLSFRQEVEFDENAFTKIDIVGGEKYVEKNSNIVQVGQGRLMQRTPELIKALETIQTMASSSAKNASRNLSRHPREVNGHIWPSK